MTKTTGQTAAVVDTVDEQAAGDAATVQLADPIPRDVGLWFRHYAPIHALSMAELIRRILRDFHGGPRRARQRDHD